MLSDCHSSVIGLLLDCYGIAIEMCQLVLTELDWQFNAVGLLWECYWIAIEMRLDCYCNAILLYYIAIGLLSNYHWSDIGLLLECYWIAIGRLLDRCCNAIELYRRVLKYIGVLLDWDLECYWIAIGLPLECYWIGIELLLDAIELLLERYCIGSACIEYIGLLLNWAGLYWNVLECYWDAIGMLLNSNQIIVIAIDIALLSACHCWCWAYSKVNTFMDADSNKLFNESCIVSHLNFRIMRARNSPISGLTKGSSSNSGSAYRNACPGENLQHELWIFNEMFTIDQILETQRGSRF